MISIDEREQRIEAAGRALASKPSSIYSLRVLAEAALDAADRAVPVVTKEHLQRAVENAVQLDMLGRLHEDRTELKQRLRATETALAACWHIVLAKSEEARKALDNPEWDT